MSDDVTVTINGMRYAGWSDIRVTRSLDSAAADFDISVTERWSDDDQPWQIAPFDACTVAIDDQPVLTGYVDRYLPAYDAETHTVRITGRSKTGDLIDCMPDIHGGQFNGQKIDRIATAVAAPFGITVKLNGDAGATLPDATLEKAETAYRFVERLARLQSLLICDDEFGNLVLTEAGAETANGALTEGDNIKSASATLTAHERFSVYAVLGQAPLSWDSEEAQIAIKGEATDPACPRYRRHAEMSEAPLDNTGAKARARWRALYNFGRSTEATIAVAGWRQANGDLWRINQLVPVISPRLALNRPLLITSVSFYLSEAGRVTELRLAPQEAYSPDPASVRLRKRKGNSDQWQGLIPVN